MDDFGKFLRLTNGQRNRIVKAAKTVDRLTRGSISFELVAAEMTNRQHAQNEHAREYRTAQRRRGIDETSHYRSVS